MFNTISGLTNFGTSKKAGGVKCISSGNNFPGVLVLQAHNTGVPIDWYLWVTAAGGLRIGAVYPTNPDTDGTAVGGQTLLAAREEAVVEEEVVEEEKKKEEEEVS